MVCESGAGIATGFGYTRTSAIIGVPGQPLAVGVMVKVTVTGPLVVLVSEPLISPLPLAAMPVAVATLSLVQLYVVAGTGLPFNTMVVMAEPEQIVCVEGVATADGVGYTVTF